MTIQDTKTYLSIELNWTTATLGRCEGRWMKGSWRSSWIYNKLRSKGVSYIHPSILEGHNLSSCFVHSSSLHTQAKEMVVKCHICIVVCSSYRYSVSTCVLSFSFRLHLTEELFMGASLDLVSGWLCRTSWGAVIGAIIWVPCRI